MTADVIADLAGQVAVVTGASRGIGRAVAEGLARAGASVVVASRKLGTCEAAAAAITEATGQEALPVACHVGRWEECDRLVRTVYEHFGRCDVLVNNAGMSPLYPSLGAITEEYYDKVSAVNLKGPFRLGVTVGERMAEGTGGSIVNISTIGSLRPSGHELVYACAKAGLNALTIGLASAYGPKVRANGLLPGAVVTDIVESWPDAMRASAIDDTPLARMGVPADFVGPVLWLAGAASALVTGTLIRVDGGKFRQMS